MVDPLITIIRLIRIGRHSCVDVGVITRAFMLGDRVLLSERLYRSYFQDSGHKIISQSIIDKYFKTLHKSFIVLVIIFKFFVP